MPCKLVITLILKHLLEVMVLNLCKFHCYTLSFFNYTFYLHLQGFFLCLKSRRSIPINSPFSEAQVNPWRLNISGHNLWCFINYPIIHWVNLFSHNVTHFAWLKLLQLQIIMYKCQFTQSLLLNRIPSRDERERNTSVILDETKNNLFICHKQRKHQ